MLPSLLRMVQSILSSAFRDPADGVDLARLMPPWNQPRIGADVSGSANAGGMIDRGHKGERGQLADARDGHQPTAGRRGSCHSLMSASIAATAVITAVRAAIRPRM